MQQNMTITYKIKVTIQLNERVKSVTYLSTCPKIVHTLLVPHYVASDLDVYTKNHYKGT